jgi:ABC-2 type transport system permease protein/oleandomycin transport system permease protein
MAQAVQIAVGKTSKTSAWTLVTESIADTAVLTRRNLLVWVRMPSFLIITVVQPIIFVLLFRFVFGGAIKVTNPGGYVEYLMPGIIAQTAAMASIATAIALARTMSRGIVDRYRSMPMARPAFLGGRLTADAVRILVTLIMIMVIGYLVGFRFRAGWQAAIAMMGLALAFGVAMCCVMAFTGLAIRNEEAVQGYGLVWLFPLTFVSSAFVPVASMPGWLQPFARNQPVTVVIDAMRALTLGGPVASSAWKAVAWILGITVVFMLLSVRSYTRTN